MQPLPATEPDLTDLSPEWLAHRYDESRNEIRFVKYSRSERAAVPFLVDGHLPPRDFRSLSRTQARALAGSAPVHFILHSGFCCSTLLSASLDQPGVASAFSEPMLLNDVVGLRLRGAPGQAVGELLEDSLALLARPLGGDGASIIKLSTVVNGLGPAMLAIRPEARAIVMHAPLQDFLVSIAKKGLDGRLWVRELAAKCRLERRLDILGFNDEQLFGQSDLQIAAIGWLAQQATFAGLLAQHPSRVRSLTSEAYLERPGEVLDASAALFGLSWSEDNRAAALAGPMARNSKDRSAFGAGDREREYREAYALHRDEIDKVSRWAAEVARVADVPMRLSSPLLA